MSKITTITFSSEELETALAKHFKIKKNKIKSWYIRSLFGGEHTLEVEE